MSKAETVASPQGSVRERPGSELLRDALECARRAHEGQSRKDGSAFIGHPMAVAALVADAGFDGEVRAAALLHDVVEDSEVGIAELEARFGEHVAALVEAMTDDPTIADYRERKAANRAKVEAAGEEALAIYAADKLVGVRELRHVYAREDESAGRLFQVTLGARIAIWRADLEAVSERVPGLPYLRELRYELESLEEQRARSDPAAA